MNSDWSLLQLSSILYSVVYGTVLQDLHLSAAPTGLEGRIQKEGESHEHRKAHAAYAMVPCPFIAGLSWNRKALALVDEVLDSARMALVEAKSGFPKKGGGRYLPTCISRALVWPADAMARVAQQAYAGALSVLGIDSPMHLRHAAWMAVFHVEDGTSGPLANVASVFRSQHGTSGSDARSIWDRKKLKRAFEAWLCPQILRTSACTLRNGSSTQAKAIIQEAENRYPVVAGAWAGFGEEAASMLHLQALLAVDNRKILGPLAMPAIARSTWRGRDGRLILRKLCGRYPRDGSMEHGADKLLTSDMARAEARHA